MKPVEVVVVAVPPSLDASALVPPVPSKQSYGELDCTNSLLITLECPILLQTTTLYYCQVFLTCTVHWISSIKL